MAGVLRSTVPGPVKWPAVSAGAGEGGAALFGEGFGAGTRGVSLMEGGRMEVDFPGFAEAASWGAAEVAGFGEVLGWWCAWTIRPRRHRTRMMPAIMLTITQPGRRAKAPGLGGDQGLRAADGGRGAAAGPGAAGAVGAEVSISGVVGLDGAVTGALTVGLTGGRMEAPGGRMVGEVPGRVAAEGGSKRRD